jgi:nucleoside triphosphate pyrophosphatase
MKQPTIMLASASPRRRELLAWLGWDFVVRAVDIDETPLDGEKPQAYVCRLASGKAEAAVEHAGNGSIILAADTTVVHEGKIMGKPADGVQADAMLRRLRNQPHQVCSAFALRSMERQHADLCVSQVPMRDYSDEEINAYVRSGDPLDKAGAYGIQNADFHPVEGFSGCFANVMGLPLCHLARSLRQFGLTTNVDIAAVCREKLDYDCPISQAVLEGQTLG